MSVASDESGQEVFVRPPSHPVPTLQGPFEESMVESVNDGTDFDVPIDAVSRRTMLLEGPTYERIIAGRWKQRPGEKYHPLWKLMAQMTFGLHLLARNLAKSEDEVMKILQAHVDDIDDFLERTSEDFELAYSDMYERLRCLKLPLQHGEVFDRMLEDRSFRASILDGNEKIEHIVSRTRKALKDALKDVQKGFDATNVLDTYLSGLSKTWQRNSPEHEAVHLAMLGNVEGWKRAFMDLHLEGNKVAGVLKKLMEIVEEMEKRAAIASRHQLAMSQASMASITQASNGARSSAKPLPRAPTQRNSTRASSRSTNNILRESSRPFSGGSNDRSSTGSTHSQTYGGRQTPNAGLNISQHRRNDSADETDLSQRTPTITQTPADNVPVELPADVPEEALRQAPMSMKNRLSYTLGLKPKDNSDHRISSIYYPKALGDLLRTQQSPPILKTRQMSTVKQESPHSSTGDYFSAHIRGSSITLIPVNAASQQSAVTTPEKATSASTDHSPVVGKIESESRASITSSPGLNSHPSVMAMVAAPQAPVELAAAGEHRRGQESRSSVGLLSSLGEPGPEVTSSEYDGSESRLSDLPTFKIHEPDSAKRAKFVSGLDLPETVMVSLAETTQAEHATDTSVSTNKSPKIEPDSATDVNVQPVPTDTIPDKENDATHKVLEVSQSHSAECDTPRQKDFVAELEADVPTPPVTPKPVVLESDFPAGPVEMEAPAAHFKLPSRASAIAIKVAPPPTLVKARTALLKARAEAAQKESSVKEEDSVEDTTINQNALLDARAEAAEKDPATKPKDSSENATTSRQPTQPLKLRLTKRDGKLVPVEVSAMPGVPSPRISTDVIASIIDQMGETPATSPVTERDTSKPSPKLGQKKFAPPNSAPAPPGPGGRPMVNPDYANIGALDGERMSPPKAPQRHSAGKTSTMAAWKDMISNAKTRRHSSDTSSKSTRRSLSGHAPGSQLLNPTTGVDVLWFKNGGKDKAGAPLGVS